MLVGCLVVGQIIFLLFLFYGRRAFPFDMVGRYFTNTRKAEID